jgi:hypothetical protein
MKNLWKTLAAVAAGAASAAGLYVITALGGLDPASFTSDPLMAGGLALVFAALTRGVQWLIGKIQA